MAQWPRNFSSLQAMDRQSWFSRLGCFETEKDLGSGGLCLGPSLQARQDHKQWGCHTGECSAFLAGRHQPEPCAEAIVQCWWFPRDTAHEQWSLSLRRRPVSSSSGASVAPRVRPRDCCAWWRKPIRCSRDGRRSSLLALPCDRPLVFTCHQGFDFLVMVMELEWVGVQHSELLLPTDDANSTNATLFWKSVAAGTHWFAWRWVSLTLI